MKNIFTIILLVLLCYGCSTGYRDALKQEFGYGYNDGEYPDEKKILGFYEYDGGEIKIKNDGTFNLYYFEEDESPIGINEYHISSSWTLESSPKWVSTTDKKGMALCLDANLQDASSFFGDESCFRYQILDDKLVIEVVLDGNVEDRELIKQD